MKIWKFLFEQQCNNKIGYYEGYTKNYMKVVAPSECEAIVGKILNVKLISTEGENIIGKII